MTYRHHHQLPSTTFPPSTPNTQTLPPALLQALHRLATFSSDIQLLTSHFAPHLHFHAHHPCFSKPTPQHFARRRKPTTRSTAWRLQNLQPSNPIPHLPASNVTTSSLIATPITKAPLRPVSAPPFNPTRHDSRMPRSSSVPPTLVRRDPQVECPSEDPHQLLSPAKLRSTSSFTTNAIHTIQSEHLISPVIAPILNDPKSSSIKTSINLELPPTNAIAPAPAVIVDFNTGHLNQETIAAIDLEPATITNQLINGKSSAELGNSEPTSVVDQEPTTTDISRSDTEINSFSATNSPIKSSIEIEIVSTTAVCSAAVGYLATGDINQDSITNIDQNRNTDSVHNGETLSNPPDSDSTLNADLAFNSTVHIFNTSAVDQGLVDDDDQEPDTTKIVSPPCVSSDLASATEIDSNLKAIKHAMVLNLDPVIENLLSSASNQQIFANGDLALTADVDLAPASDSSPAIAPIPNAPDPTIETVIDDTLLSSTAIDPQLQPSATIGPLIDDLGLVKSEVIHPLRVFVSAIHFGSETDIHPTPSPSPLTNTVTSQINNTSSSTNKKKKKKKKKKKTLAIDDNLSEQHYCEYDVTEYFHPKDGWIENDRHSSGYPISLDTDPPPLPQQDTHTSSTSNTLHLVDLIQKLLFRHRMYELLQVIEEGIILGKEPGQDPNHQDVIFYSHEGEFMFRRTKDAKIFCDLDELED